MRATQDRKKQAVALTSLFDCSGKKKVGAEGGGVRDWVRAIVNYLRRSLATCTGPPA